MEIPQQLPSHLRIYGPFLILLNERLIWLLFPLQGGRNRTVHPQRGDELNTTRNARHLWALEDQFGVPLHDRGHARANALHPAAEATKENSPGRRKK